MADPLVAIPMAVPLADPAMAVLLVADPLVADPLVAVPGG